MPKSLLLDMMARVSVPGCHVMSWMLMTWPDRQAAQIKC